MTTDIVISMEMRKKAKIKIDYGVDEMTQWFRVFVAMTGVVSDYTALFN